MALNMTDRIKKQTKQNRKAAMLSVLIPILAHHSDYRASPCMWMFLRGSWNVKHICHHYHRHPHQRFVFPTWTISFRALLLSPVSEQWNWQEASCLPVCLPVLHSLLLPPPSVITSFIAHRLTIRWGRGHKHSTATSSRQCGILNSPPCECCRLTGGFLHIRGATACGPISQLGLEMLNFVLYH